MLEPPWGAAIPLLDGGHPDKATEPPRAQTNSRSQGTPDWLDWLWGRCCGGISSGTRECLPGALERLPLAERPGGPPLPQWRPGARGMEEKEE